MGSCLGTLALAAVEAEDLALDGVVRADRPTAEATGEPRGRLAERALPCDL